MQISLYFPLIKPITLNHATKYRAVGRRAMSYKSPAYKKLESQINSLMNKGNNKKAVSKFNKNFDENKHQLQVEYKFYYPIKLKGKNRISKTSMDLSNIEKNIQDCIFKSLIADDSCITRLVSEKIHSEQIEIKTSIKILNL